MLLVSESCELNQLTSPTAALQWGLSVVDQLWLANPKILNPIGK